MAIDVQKNILASIEGVLSTYGESIVSAIKDKLSATGKVPSGKMEGSVTFNIVKLDTSIKLQILTADYLNWLETGRKAGKMPPIDVIIKWIILKGIKPRGFPKRSKSSLPEKQTRMAFAIAKSIAKKGIKRKPVVTPIINKAVSNFIVDIGKAVNVALSQGITDTFVAAVDETNNNRIKIIRTQ